MDIACEDINQIHPTGEALLETIRWTRLIYLVMADGS